MIEISVKLQVYASQDKVWGVISEIDDDPKYWKGIESVRNLSWDHGTIKREVTLFNGNKCNQKIILFPKEGIHVRWIRGPVTGIKDIMLTRNGDATIIEVQISYNLSGAVRLVSRQVLEELRKEAELALQLIKEKVENDAAAKESRLWTDLING